MASPALPKPEKRWHVYAYDYHECRDYLQARDGYNERDYAGKFTGNFQAPYQDFWHFVIAKCPHIRSAGCEFVMHEGWKKDAEPWQHDILLKYLDTFGQIHNAGERFIDFYVWW